MSTLPHDIQRAHIPQWRRGDRVTAVHLNKMVDPLNKLVSGVGLPRPVLRKGSPKQQFIIATDGMERGVQDEYLDCHTYDDDGTTGAEWIKVMRPWGLRAYQETYSRNGKRVSYGHAQRRTVTLIGTSTSELQAMTPDYFIGDVIIAERGISGGVIGDPELSQMTEPVEWIENTDSRAWAAINGA